MAPGPAEGLRAPGLAEGRGLAPNSLQDEGERRLVCFGFIIAMLDFEKPHLGYAGE